MLCRGQVDDQVAAGAEQAEELLAQGGSGRDAEFPAERGDDVAAAVCPGGKTEAGIIMSRGACHSASDHMSRGQAGWRAASRDAPRAGTTAWRGLGASSCAAATSPCGTRRPRAAVCAPPRDLRWHRRDRWLGRDGAVCVTSEGIGGTGGLGAVPWSTAADAGPWRSGAVVRDLRVSAGQIHQAPASSAGTRQCERHRHQRS